MATEAQIERKRKKIERAMDKLRGSSGEPMVSSENYKVEIARAMNWYNANEENRTMSKYAIAYIKFLKRTDLIYAISEASDFELKYIGIIGRLIMREQYVSPEHVKYIHSKMEDLGKKYVKTTVVTVDNKLKSKIVLPSVQDKIIEAARMHATKIDDEIDYFIKNKTSDFSMRSYLLANSISGAVSKRIAEYYKSMEKELAEAVEGKDEQLNEGYSYFTKAQLKRFHEFIKGIIADCTQQIVTTRAPRKRKPVPPTKLVQKLKYMKEFPELSLKSILPTEIIGAKELWVYNTKYRKLTVYSGDLSVKGTTIIGYEIAGTDTKSIRKPEEFFKTTQIGKRPLNAAFKAIKAKPSTPNGRINDDCVLIAAFK